jgi:predicted nucleic acid-binding protein
LPGGIEASDPRYAFLQAMALAGEADDLVTGDRCAGLLQRGSIGHAHHHTAVFFAEAL